MMRVALPTALATLATLIPGSLTTVCAQVPKAGTWVRVAENSSFSARDTAEGVVFDGKMWLSNGYANGRTTARDLFCSTDGRTWTLVNPATPYDEFSEMVAYNGKLWAIKESVWHSTDGVTWTRVAEKTPFGIRPYGEVVVHDGKMWQLGCGRDVWYSTDGVNWSCATEDAPFGARVAAAVAVFGGRIWLMGGVIGQPNTPPELIYPDNTTLNDVWCSADGVHWERVLEHAPWAARTWFASQEYLGCLWIFGGFDNVRGANLGDVWCTKDGINWEPHVAPAMFTPRHEPTPYVFKDGLWLAGGNGWPLLNDVWQLSLPSLPPPQRLMRITMMGTGSGAVTSTPKGLECGPGCLAYDLNATVRLTAAVSARSEFEGWSGEGCSGMGDCTVDMAQSHSVMARFTLPGSSPVDFNSDGKTDIVWRNRSSGEVLIWLMDGDRRFASSSLGVVDLNWKVAGIADFNGDEGSDILWRDSSTGENYIWLMNGTSHVGGAWIESVADIRWEIVGARDFNGDGMHDILWRHSGTGENYVWFMNGVARSDGASLPPVSDPNWRALMPID